jgi:hypothetical protein
VGGGAGGEFRRRVEEGRRFLSNEDDRDSQRSKVKLLLCRSYHNPNLLIIRRSTCDSVQRATSESTSRCPGKMRTRTVTYFSCFPASLNASFLDENILTEE